MNTTLDDQPISTTPDDPKWPEPLRDKPVTDPFPTKLLWKWLTPGIIGLTILSVIYGLLYQAANRQIVFLSRSGQLTAVRANNPLEPMDLDYSIAQSSELNIATGQASILPIPQWSPNGRYMAVTIRDRGQIRAAIFPQDLLTPTILPPQEDLEWTAAPGNAWSYSSTYLAVLAHDGEQLLVAVYDTRQRNYLYELQQIDTRVGLNWSPQQDELIFTANTNEMPAPTLRIIDSNGNLANFIPEDNQLMHADGIWSPDGQQIAYIASTNYTDTQDILWGNLWVTDREGKSPRHIAIGDNIFAPFWDPRGDYLYFTRFTRSARFELYRIDTSGSQVQEEYVGPGSDAAVLYPFHRNLFAQWSSNNKQLLFFAHGQVMPSNYRSVQVYENIETQMRQVLPMKFISQWSPDGQQLAGTIIDGDTIVVFIFDEMIGQGLNYTAEGSDMLAFPANGWSPDSRYVALLRYDGTNTKLAVLEPKEGALGTAGFDLNVRAGFSWNPSAAQLIATSLEEGITTSLKIYDASANSVSDFEPEDGQLLRADGVWSPGDGRKVAYIARDTLTDTLGLDFLAGSLWIAESDASSAQQLVADGLNFAPIWIDQERIIFTRFMTETDTFQLYDVDVTNRNVERLGLSTSEFAEFPFDRQTLLNWSPEGQYWSLLGARTETPFILYSTAADNVTVAKFPEQCNAATPFIARWSPTNRGVLLACPSGSMFLHWTDRERANKEYPAGLYPSWQP